MANKNKSKVDPVIVKNCREAQAVQAAYVLDLMIDAGTAEEIADARADLQRIEAKLGFALAGNKLSRRSVRS